MGGLRRWFERFVPDRVCRSYIVLLALISMAFAIVGPSVGSLAYYGAYRIPITYTYPRSLLANIVGFAVAIAFITVVLHRRRSPGLPLRAAIGYTLAYDIVGTLARYATIRPLRVGPGDGTGAVNTALQLFLVFALVGIVIVAMAYAAWREEALEETFTELTRSQQALAHEEESVRGRVFDQLHGTVQAEIVAVRRSLSDIAAQTGEPMTRAEVEKLDRRLDDLYQTSIRSIAVALSPAGLDAGLAPALRELAIRLEGAAVLVIDIDHVVAVLDDPMRGGMHRQVRTAAFRVIEEAVANALRHSHAREVRIRVSSALERGSAIVDLRIEHDIDERPTIIEGEGLRRMRARIESVGGSLHIRSTDAVLRVDARLPLARPDEGRFAT